MIKNSENGKESAAKISGSFMSTVLETHSNQCILHRQAGAQAHPLVCEVISGKKDPGGSGILPRESHLSSPPLPFRQDFGEFGSTASEFGDS